MTTHYNTLKIDVLNIFYREAGDKNHPALVLLHGFPSSSHMFRNLIPQLAAQYHVVAPAGQEAFKGDLPHAEIHFFDDGHFALGEYHHDIAARIVTFLSNKCAKDSEGEV